MIYYVLKRKSTFAHFPSFRRLSAGTTRSVSGEEQGWLQQSNYLAILTIMSTVIIPIILKTIMMIEMKTAFQMNCMSKPLLQKYSWQPIVQECIIYHREYILHISILCCIIFNIYSTPIIIYSRHLLHMYSFKQNPVKDENLNQREGGGV